MELPPISSWFSVILLVSCFIGIPALLFIGWLISGAMDNKSQSKRELQDNTLRKRGILAPAIVVSAVKGRMRSPFGRKEMRIAYEVDVEPEESSAFRTTFETWATKTNYTAVNNRLVDEVGRKIWVTYDPNDPKKMIFEYYDSEREKILAQKVWGKRRSAFEKAEKENQVLRNSGEEASATILEVEDLELAYNWENAKAMRLKFEVVPKSGTSFQAEAHALIANTAFEKYSVGKKVYVKFDPREPARVVLQRSA